MNLNPNIQSELQYKVLIVEDEALTRTLISKALESAMFDVIGSVNTPTLAMKLFLEFKPDVILLDVDLGSGPSGIDIANAVHKINPKTGIAFISSLEDVRKVRPNLPMPPPISKFIAKQEVKEIRFGPNTDEHDFEFKVKHAEKFLAAGDKVRAFVLFRGRAIVYKERGELLLLQFAQKLQELGKVEQLPKLEGKKMFLMMSPKGKQGK